MAITKYLPSKPFSSGTEYEVFKYNYCNRCKKHKEREDGFPAFPEDGGCPIEDAMEFARFDRERFPGDKIRKLIDSDGDVAKWHHCMEFETWQVNKMSELKRCPFCGGEAELLKGQCEIDNYVMCLECRSKTKLYNTKASAIKAWNTRKPMKNIVKRLEIKLSDTVYEPATQESNGSYLDGLSIGYCEAIGIVKEEGGET